jgi:UDPglucose 6-dehydrogenase
MNTPLELSVFGLGFVGLTSALGFAEKGFRVIGCDINKNRLETIAKGAIPFLERGVDSALQKHLGNKFSITANAEEAVKKSDIVFLCVGTPCGENGKADLAFLFSALDSVLPVIQDGKFRVLVIKSTVPPGTTQDEVIPYLQKKGFYDGNGFAVVNNPEFLREGKCWDDFINPDRIVCGAKNRQAMEMLKELYKPFSAPIHFVSWNTGEFIKYLSNTMLASMISYSNEMSKIADGIGDIDTGRAFRILHEDRRLKNSGIASYLYPGCGYGGYCLPKDTQALAAQAESHNIIPRILNEVIATNTTMPEYFVKKIEASVPSTKIIGILGLSFKPESDDVRDSPAARIIDLLIRDEYTNILVYDPVAMQPFSAVYQFEHIHYFDTKEAVCQKSDCIVLVTAWNEFKHLRSVYPGKTWVDCRYFLNSMEGIYEN